jgi:hypothetical protein
MKRSPGRYQELDLFIKVLRLLCPNLTDASSTILGKKLITKPQESMRGTASETTV